MTVSLSCRTSYGLSSVNLLSAVLVEVVYLHVPGSTTFFLQVPVSPIVGHFQYRLVWALPWGIPSKVAVEILLWGSSPSRVFTEDVSIRLSSRAVFSSPRRMVLFPDIPVSSRSRFLSGVFGLPYGRRVVPGGWFPDLCIEHVCSSAFIIHF
jgi:hypothetical protein